MIAPPPDVDAEAWERGLELARVARDVGVRELGDMAASLEGSVKVDDVVKRQGARYMLGQYQAQIDAESQV